MSKLLALALVLAAVAGCAGDDDNADADADTIDGAAPTSSSVLDVTITAAAATTTAITTTTTPPPPLLVERRLDTLVEQPADLPGYNVYRPTDLDATGAPLPVIAWANGGCVRFDGVWQAMLNRWAAGGFVVVSITTPASGEVDRADVTSANDQALAIDWAEAQNSDPASDLVGHLDLDRVVAAGNSCGGITSVALAASDPRVAAVFVLSGSGSFPGSSREAAAEVMRQITVPVAFVVGGTEDIANGPAHQDYEVLPDGVPSYVVSRSSGDHPTVSTDPDILDDAADIGLNWLDLVLYGNDAARTNLTTIPCGGCEAGLWTPEHKHLETLVAP